MTSRSRREINSSIVFAGVDGPVPHYGALDAICPETQFRLSHQSATGQEKLALAACLIEVKDYRQHRRTKLIDLGDEVAGKVRDTLSGLAAASANANNNDERALAQRMLAQRRWRVVFHLEQPRVRSRLRPRPYDVANVESKLRRQLKAIDAHPVVLDHRDLRGDIPWTVQ